jgi:signal transduction histidine kinase
MSLLDVGIGAIEIAFAAVLAVTCLRLRRSGWLVVFSIFFGLRGLDRVLVGIVGHEPEAIGLALDVVLAGVLVVLVVTARQALAEVERTQIEAEIRGREYERALRDYRRVARHRLATPVTAILGSAQALREIDELDEPTRVRLLDSILEEARRLQEVALDPDAPLAPEERALRPAPRLDYGTGERCA